MHSTTIGRRFAAAFVIAAALAQPGVACAQEATVQPAVVVRPGDRDLSCDALATEINQLATADALPAERPRRRGLGLLRALSTASPLLGMVGNGVAGLAASQAAGLASQEAATAQTDDAMARSLDAASGRQSIGEQRRARLTQIFEEKRC